jgi:hypothetical protein
MMHGNHTWGVAGCLLCAMKEGSCERCGAKAGHAPWCPWQELGVQRIPPTLRAAIRATAALQEPGE